MGAAKRASVLSKLKAARHARLALAKGGTKALLKFKGKLFSNVARLEKHFKAKFEACKKKVKATLHKLKAKIAKRLKRTHSSKKYVEQLHHYFAKAEAAKKKAMGK